MPETRLEDLATALPRMRDRWLGGADAAQMAPPAWTTNQHPDDGLRLLALAGHALSVLRHPLPAGELSLRPPLPTLAAPLLLDERRLLLRRALAAQRRQPDAGLDVVRLLAARGFAAHPEDWKASLPDLARIDLYAPWAAWQEGSSQREDGEYPTAETWKDWGWSEGRAALARLRGRDPGAALELLSAVMQGESAERRVQLANILDAGLTAADKPLIEILATDRSDRVKAEARRLLARLGDLAAPGEAETELKDFFELKRAGLLRRRTELVLRPLKTPAQANRANGLLAQTSLSAFAAVLELSQEDLVLAWAPTNTMLDVLFVQCLAQTGSEQAREAFVARWEAGSEFDPVLLTSLSGTLQAGHRRRLVRSVVMRGATFAPALAVTGHDTGWMESSQIRSGDAWKGLMKAATPDDSSADQEQLVSRELWALGLLCNAAAASATLHALTECGHPAADPTCDLLRLNAALTETQSP